MLHCGTKEIRTPRLTLRRFVPEDAPAMFRNWASDPEVTKYLTWPAHSSPSVTEWVLADWISSYSKADFYQWAIVLREQGEEPIGCISVVHTDDTVSAVEIGYCLGRAWWHQGIMSEALSAVIDFFFAETDAQRVCARHDPANPRSGQVMRKCGMTYEGTLRRAGRNNQGICDVSWYSILREEHRVKQSVEQYVMAYGVEQDRLRALLPEGFTSLRPVLRINAEIRGGSEGYLELNTPVEFDGNKGWVNIAFWEHVPFERSGKTVVFKPDFLEIRFTGVGIEGSCPAEKDNIGCYFPGSPVTLRKAESIKSRKEFCDCSFRWSFHDGDAHGVSLGKTLPAVPTPIRTIYSRAALTAENAAAIPCDQVLGAYVVRFDR